MSYNRIATVSIGAGVQVIIQSRIYLSYRSPFVALQRVQPAFCEETVFIPCTLLLARLLAQSIKQRCPIKLRSSLSFNRRLASWIECVALQSCSFSRFLYRLNSQLLDLLKEAITWIEENEPETLEFSCYLEDGKEGVKLSMFERQASPLICERTLRLYG